MKKQLPNLFIYFIEKYLFYILLFIPMVLTAQQHQVLSGFCATEDIIIDNSIYSFSDNISDLDSFPERTFNVYFWELRESNGDSRVKLQHEDFIRNIKQS